MVRFGLRKLFEEQNEYQICGESDNLEDAERELESLQPDFLVTEIRIQGMSAFRWIEKICRRIPECRILISTIHDEPVFVDRAIRSGAHGFVSKTDPGSAFLEALKYLGQGKSFISQSVYHSMANAMRLTPPNCSANGNAIRGLSKREFEVFELIGTGRGANEIATELSISAKTVEAHRQNIRNKLGLRNMSELICRAAVWQGGA